MAWSQTLHMNIMQNHFHIPKLLEKFYRLKTHSNPIFYDKKSIMPTTIPKYQEHCCHELDVIMIAVGFFTPLISQIYSTLHGCHRNGLYTTKLCKQKNFPSNTNKLHFPSMELASCGIILRKLNWTLKNFAKNSLPGWHNTSIQVSASRLKFSRNQCNIRKLHDSNKEKILWISEVRH